MSTTIEPIKMECWSWADEKLESSDYAAFEVSDCEYDPETGEHRYFDDFGRCIVVEADGEVLPRDSGFSF
jgi:hypothetical protein